MKILAPYDGPQKVKTSLVRLGEASAEHGRQTGTDSGKILFPHLIVNPTNKRLQINDVLFAAVTTAFMAIHGK